jgi:hypothetical protein
MGLYIHSLEHIPTSARRSYFIYLLDYGWHEPLGEAMNNNYEKMAAIAAVNDAVVIKGTDEHFQNEVLSWHNVNGDNSEDMLPAILIANGHPSKFRYESLFDEEDTDENLKFILIPLKKFCSTTTEVVSLIDKLFNDIKEKKDLNDFRIAKEINKGVGRALVDSLILEPNFNGIGFSFNKFADYIQKRKK